MTFTPILTLTAVRRYPCTVVLLLRQNPYLGAYGPATLALESGREPKLGRQHKYGRGTMSSIRTDGATLK